MSHPFGDLVSQHLHRKHGLSQSKLAAGIQQAPTVVTAMCKGKRMTGPQARERVIAIISWLREQEVLDTIAEANALLNAAGKSSLNTQQPIEAALVQVLRSVLEHQPDTASRRETRRHNLPAQPTSFIGRESDAAELADRIKTTRLLTLTGAGGCGKTRLALKVTVDAQDAFVDGVWLVELASIMDVELVPRAVANTFGLVDQPNTPPLGVLTNYLASKRAQLILDNCEHLIEACAQFVAHVLQHCPNIHILATSRESLRVAGETNWRVPSLPQDESIRLFRERACAIRPDLKLNDADIAIIADICQQLDGIPLAIELAAARINALTPKQIADRIG